MKKKLIAIIVGMMLCAELLGGCGNKNINKDNITTDTAEESKQQDSNKKQELPTATYMGCLLYTSPSPRDLSTSRMPSSA